MKKIIKILFITILISTNLKPKINYGELKSRIKEFDNQIITITLSINNYYKNFKKTKNKSYKEAIKNVLRIIQNNRFMKIYNELIQNLNFEETQFIEEQLEKNGYKLESINNSPFLVLTKKALKYKLIKYKLSKLYKKGNLNLRKAYKWAEKVIQNNQITTILALSGFIIIGAFHNYHDEINVIAEQLKTNINTLFHQLPDHINEIFKQNNGTYELDYYALF